MKPQKINFVPTRITDFVPADIKKFKRDPHSLPLDGYFIRCSHCGSSHVIKKGWRERKRKGDWVRRFFCEKCHRKFIQDPTKGSHFPEWVVETVLNLSVKGLEPKDITEEVTRESRSRGQSVTMSSQTVLNIIRRSLNPLLEFEQLVEHVETSREWQIDDTPEIFPGKGKNKLIWIDKLTQDGKKLAWVKKPVRINKKIVPVTNVIAIDTRYWLVGFVSSQRTTKASLNALEVAKKRAKYEPLEVKCDGWLPHAQAIKKCLPRATINSKTKEKSYGHINYIESLHSIMRRAGIKKRGRFRSKRTLQLYVDLFRFYYNFLRPHKGLNGETPASRAGIFYPSTSSWVRLIHFADYYVRSRKL